MSGLIPDKLSLDYCMICLLVWLRLLVITIIVLGSRLCSVKIIF